MSDHIVRAIAKEAGLLAIACVATEVTQEAVRRQEALPVAAGALGYGLAGAALMGALLKVQQRVAIKIEANGPLEKMVVESDSYGHVRGYISQPAVPAVLPIDQELVADALGRLGLLTVVKDVGMQQLYEGVVPLQTGLLDKDLMYYLAQSEQILSLMELGVAQDGQGKLVAVGGFLLHAMPSYDIGVLERLVERSEDLPPVENLLTEGRTPTDIVAELFGDVAYEVLEERTLVYRCSCSRESSLRALRMLPREDLLSLVAEGEAVIDCHFCRERYVFDRAELEHILAEQPAIEEGSGGEAGS